MIIPSKTEIHHGVLMNISGHGVFIIGQAGIGKSSLALEFLHLGHQLIADDVAEFSIDSANVIIGQCPELLKGLLHTRELGLMALSELFDHAVWSPQIKLDFVIKLHHNIVQSSAIMPTIEHYSVCGQSFPMLLLATSTPSPLSCRILTWLKMQSVSNNPEKSFYQHQQHLMALG